MTSVAEKFEKVIESARTNNALPLLRRAITLMDVDGDGYLSAVEIDRIDTSMHYNAAVAQYAACNKAPYDYSRQTQPITTHVGAMARMGGYYEAQRQKAECLSASPLVHDMSQDEYNVAANLTLTQRNEIKYLRDNMYLMPLAEMLAPGELERINGVLRENDLLQLHPDYVRQFKQVVEAPVPTRVVASR